MDTIRAIVKTLRLPFLVLTPVCVFLGLGTALQTYARIDVLSVLLALLGAISAHISANTFNEYYDYHSGLDSKTNRTPFSGGSGALPETPKLADAVFVVAVCSLAITILIGIYFVYLHGVSILPLGLVGVVIVTTYTQWINRFPLLCLIAPGLGFGPLMVVGTHFVLTGEYSGLALTVSLVPFFLVNNLLLLNQYPDLQADLSVGRNHFPVAFGTTRSNIVYGVFMIAGYLTIIIGVAADYLPKTSLIALISLIAATVALFGAIRYATNVNKLIPYLGMNVAVAVLTPLLLGVALIID